MAVNAKQQNEVLAVCIDSKSPIRDTTGNKSIVERYSLQVHNNLNATVDGFIAQADLIPQSYNFDKMVGYQSPKTDFAEEFFAKAAIGSEVKQLTLTNGVVDGCAIFVKVANSTTPVATDWKTVTLT